MVQPIKDADMQHKKPAHVTWKKFMRRHYPYFARTKDCGPIQRYGLEVEELLMKELVKEIEATKND